MTIERALVGTTDAAAVAANYIEDVFSTYLYSGTGASQTINNGIDLATKGGLVWIKDRTNANNGKLTDTSRGTNSQLSTEATSVSGTRTDMVTSFLSTGFGLGVDALGFTNYVGANFVSWTFRKAAKFFDIVTYTGTGSARTIAHSLGATPGMIIVKRTDTTGNWKVYHNGLTSAAYYCHLNTTADQASDTTVWNSTAPTSSVFSVGTHADVNASGGTYVAYIYATSGAGGFGSAGTSDVIACGGGTLTSGLNYINIGWEPQIVMFKMLGQTSNWFIFDNMRGSDQTKGVYLLADTSGAENSFANKAATPYATGFIADASNIWGANPYIYLAIRRPMKTPTDATKVFAPVARTGTGSATSVTSLGFSPDLLIGRLRTLNGDNTWAVDKLRGRANYLSTSATGAENFAGSGASTSTQDITSFDQSGYSYGSPSNTNFNSSGYTEIDWVFKRATGFFDVVCWTGSGSVGTVSHNLGVTPELVIYKTRSTSQIWGVYNPVGITGTLVLSSSSAANSGNSTSWFNGLAPTASVLNVGTTWNGSSTQYIAYLFATCPGVSKVFSFTGNGSSQTIDCGFTAGARFVLIKRTDSTGSWWVFDSARGIVSAADPALQLNSTAAEVTSADAIDPDSSGFIVNQETTCNLNVSSGTYVFLAIA